MSHAKPPAPLHSIAHCPICGGGLLGVRLCHGDPTGRLARDAGNHHEGDTVSPHGLIICDECEALWRHPDMRVPHEYPAAEDAKCPRCQTDLWEQSHWASLDEVSRIGWMDDLDRELDFDPEPTAEADDGSAGGNDSFGDHLQNGETGGDDESGDDSPIVVT